MLTLPPYSLSRCLLRTPFTQQVSVSVTPFTQQVSVEYPIHSAGVCWVPPFTQQVSVEYLLKPCVVYLDGKVENKGIHHEID